MSQSKRSLIKDIVWFATNVQKKKWFTVNLKIIKKQTMEFLKIGIFLNINCSQKLYFWEDES